MNIYVSNLSSNVNDADLKELFEEYGMVSSAKVITDKFTGESRGFGFIEMSDDLQGQKAIDELNQCEYDSKVINVAVAKPKAPRTGGDSFNRRGNSNNYNSRRGNNRY